MKDEQVEHEDTDALAANIREGLLWRSQGMTERLREELFAQRRLVRDGYEEVPPALVVDSAEGTTIFHGLNHSRKLTEPINKALEKISREPAAAVTDYERKLRAARGIAAPDDPEQLG